jgi:cell division protein FtsL
MSRFVTFLWVAIAGIGALALYQLKHEVIALEKELARLNREIVREQEAIHVLRAEWSHVNRPERLQALAQRHLDLQPMTPRQFGRVETIQAPRAEAPRPAAAQERR